MSFFIKTEQFNRKSNNLPKNVRQSFIDLHIQWVENLIDSGLKVSSGYLINQQKRPGGGGFLILQANNFDDAKEVIQQDPLIVADLVSWQLEEWIPVAGNLIL